MKNKSLVFNVIGLHIVVMLVGFTKLSVIEGVCAP